MCFIHQSFALSAFSWHTVESLGGRLHKVLMGALLSTVCHYAINKGSAQPSMAPMQPTFQNRVCTELHPSHCLCLTSSRKNCLTTVDLGERA